MREPTGCSAVPSRRGGPARTLRARRPLLAVVFVPLALLGGPAGPVAPTDLLAFFGEGTFEPLVKELAGRARADGLTAVPLPGSEAQSNRFYVDRSLPDGKDDQATLGVETANFVFHIGHGGASAWTSFQDREVALRDVQLGEGDLRYLWLTTCKGMAHGPVPFDEPHSFRPTAPLHSQLNVFARWGGRYEHGDVTTTPLDGGFRLACGGSTELEIPSIEKIGALWAMVASGGTPADTFLNAFGSGSQVPLCIARGGPDPEATPLYDTAFEREPNAKGDGDYLYIQYPVTVDDPAVELVTRIERFLAASGVVAWPGAGALAVPQGFAVASQHAPVPAPVLTLDPLPIAPSALRSGFLADEARAGSGFGRLSLLRVREILAAGAPSEDAALSVAEAAAKLVWAANPTLYFQPCSGALSLRGRWAPPRHLEGLPDPETIPLPALDAEAAEALAELESVIDKAPASARPVRRAVTHRRVDMYIDRAPRSLADGVDTAADIDRYIKYHRIELATGIEIGGALLPILGEGGTASLDIGADGSLLGSSIGARRITGCRDPACADDALLSRDEADHRARTEATRLLGIETSELTSLYRPPVVTWGYLEAPATCHQREMGIAYRYTFEPRQEADVLAVVIDVPAQDVAEPICLGDDDGAGPNELPDGCMP